MAKAVYNGFAAVIAAAGMQDSIFPIFGVKRAWQQVEKAYQLAGAPEMCSLVIGDKGHLNYADLIWAEYARFPG